MRVTVVVGLVAASLSVAIRDGKDAEEVNKLAQARVAASRKACDLALAMLRERVQGARAEDVHVWAVR